MPQPLERIGNDFHDCLTSSCSENKCALVRSGMSEAQWKIVHGTRYQKSRRFSQKLCDRIVFYAWKGFYVAAVELKGGKNLDVMDAREQIQNGLEITQDAVQHDAVTDWFPLLFTARKLTLLELKLLVKNPVSFKDQPPKVVIRRDCGTSFRNIIQGNSLG